VESEDDEEIDSDEAFDESDEERFSAFKFLGSKSGRVRLLIVPKLTGRRSKTVHETKMTRMRRRVSKTKSHRTKRAIWKTMRCTWISLTCLVLEKNTSKKCTSSGWIP
jgi:hypothetical protein